MKLTQNRLFLEINDQSFNPISRGNEKKYLKIALKPILFPVGKYVNEFENLFKKNLWFQICLSS